MKILSIVCDLNKGGTQRAAQIFAEAYKKLGHDSRLLSFYGLGTRYNELKDEIKIWNGFSVNNIEQIKQWSPDVIHIHSHALGADDVNRLLESLPLNKIKVIEQNVFSKPSPWMDKVDNSFQFSHWAYWLYRLNGGDLLHASVIPNPVRSDKFIRQDSINVSRFRREHNIPNDAFVIGRIGQSGEGKWSIMLIDIFNRLADRYANLFLIIVNPPVNIIKAINKSAYKNRIKYIERIDGDKNLSLVYSSFDIMLHIAEMGESFGYVLAESILCGTPVVTLSTPWGDNSQSEVVSNGIGGYVANSRKTLIEIVEKYINKIIIHDTNDARQSIVKRYDYLVVAQKALDSLNIKHSINVPELNAKIIAISRDTVDKTKLLTILLLKMNCLLCRKLTAYQYHFKTLIGTLVRKLVNKINVNKK